MSRKYCASCGEKHENDEFGLCNRCLSASRAYEEREIKRELAQWREFMELPEEDRWEQVFDFMRKQGWRLYP